MMAGRYLACRNKCLTNALLRHGSSLPVVHSPACLFAAFCPSYFFFRQHFEARASVKMDKSLTALLGYANRTPACYRSRLYGGPGFKSMTDVHFVQAAVESNGEL